MNDESFDIKILNKSFFLQDREISTQTAVLTTKTGKELTFAYISNEILKEKLQTNNFFLENCLIDDIKGIYGNYETFQIKNCFIKSENIDIDINCATLTIENSIFAAKKISLERCVFTKETVFKNCDFYCEEFSMTESKFESGLSIKSCNFTEGIKIFEGIEIKQGETNFSNTDFGGGTVSFKDAKLGEGKKFFTLSDFGDGFTDFTRTDFGNGSVVFERANFGNGNLSFRQAHFGSGITDFRRCVFGDGEKNFSKTIFDSGDVKFMNSDFGDGKVSFRQSYFGDGNLDFHFSNFQNSDIIFDRVKFNRGTFDFRGVEHKKGRISFNHVEFDDGDLIFESFAQNNGSLNFKNCVFGRSFLNFENIICKNTNFKFENIHLGTGKFSFQNADVNEIILNNVHLTTYTDLRFKNCKKLDLSKSVIKDILDLNPTDGKLHIDKINLQSVRLLGKIYIDWNKSGIKELIYSQDSSFTSKSEQFRLLKENFRMLGFYDEEDKAYVEFKRLQAKAKIADLQNYNMLKRIHKRINYFFEFLIFDRMGQYATNPVRVLTSMGLVYLFFSFLFLALEYIFPNNAQILSSLFDQNSPLVMSLWAKAFYHSAITFLTIGYGDYYPVGIIRILSAVEGFTGLFLMSYFTVAFVRKILR